jgi:hypothetical protein
MTKIVKTFIVVSGILWVLSLIIKAPTSFDDFLLLSKSVVDILTPIGVFLLGYLGLIQWREEADYKKKSSLAEEIATLVLSFTEILDLYRESWADMSMGEFVMTTGDKKADNKAMSNINSLNILFDPERFSNKVERLEKVRTELDWNLKQASTLWNDPRISMSSQKLFTLFYDFQNTVFRINQNFPENYWSFGLEDIEENRDLQLIYKFKVGTRNKTIDELNDFFDKRLQAAKLEITSLIERYLTPNPR